MVGFLWSTLVGCVIFGAGQGSAVAEELATSKGDALENSSAYLPPYLHGAPETKELHEYGPGVERAPHTARGPGLMSAVTGETASFTIQLVFEDGQPYEGPGCWNVKVGCLIYVWIANDKHIFIAEVENNGNGTLTASYSSDFAGSYLVHIDDLQRPGKDTPESKRGRPIEGSPFELEITGPSTAPDLDKLPLCITRDDELKASFWRPGSWVSSRIAGATHGVLRTGWVFQPENCAYEAFSYEDIMAIANGDTPTWVLVLGGSVQRGLFLTLVDMALAKGQKDLFAGSALQKCWGWSDFRIGNLRFSYQDMRLWLQQSKQDLVQCNDEKLVAGSTRSYVHDAEEALRAHFFAEGMQWPDTIVGPTQLVDSDDAPNYDTEVMLDGLPAEWNGRLLLLEHNSAYGSTWHSKNPTKRAWDDVLPCLGREVNAPPSSVEGRLARMERYQEQDPRVTYMSTLPIYQPILFENQDSFKKKTLCYGCSQHYHYTASRNEREQSHDFSVMVQSMTTEMVGNIILGMSVGTKQALRPSVQGDLEEGSGANSSVRKFEVCSDCPKGLLPFHIKPIPDASCAKISSLAVDWSYHAAWDRERCPAWCLNNTDPTGVIVTESGVVDVRECRP